MTFVKDPAARLDYAVDWSAWLPEGDTVAAAEWLPGGLTVDGTSLAGAVATVWLTGGTPGVTYRVTCRVTTTAGRIDDRTMRIFVAER